MTNITFEEILGALSLFLSTGAISSVLSSLISLALYILQGFALYKLSEKLGIKNGWLGFIPFANLYLLGKISDVCRNKNGEKTVKYSLLLLIFEIVIVVLTVALVIFLLIALVSVLGNVELAIEYDELLTPSMFVSFIPVLAIFFVLFATAIAYKVFYSIALWRIFSVFSKQNTVLFLVICIVIDSLVPIFLFAVCNKLPVFEGNNGYFDTGDV